MDDHGRRALEEIYEEFFPRIYNYIYYRLLHREETEDLVSRIFLRVAEHLQEYDPKKAKLDTWIFRTSETPRWKENGGDQCLGITEYYDEMLHLMERLVQEDFRIRVDIWQFAVFNPITGIYHYQPVQGGCRAISTAFTGDFLHYDPSKCAFFKGGYMKRIDQVFAKAARAYRCMDDTGDMDKGGERE